MGHAVEEAGVRAALHIDPPLAVIPTILRAAGLDAFQTTLRNPQRFGKHGVPDLEDQNAFRTATSRHPLWGIAHASLLTNLASLDGRIRNASASSLLGDLKLAAQLGLAGVCFHVGYAKGHANLESALAAAVRKLGQVIAQMPTGTHAVIENCCEGSEIGQTIAEVGKLVRDLGAPGEQLGVLIDTCHLHAAGFDLGHRRAGEQLADVLVEEGLLDRLVGFHLNDCQVPCGGRRDRHAVPGEGTIGDGLLSIVGHKAFAGLPLILEVSAEEAHRGIAFLAQTPHAR